MTQTFLLKFKTVFAVLILVLLPLASHAHSPAAKTQAPAWSVPNSSGPFCAPEGQMCKFDGDCCQGVCKNSIVCEAPLFCVPNGYGCNQNDECCEGACDLKAHSCVPLAH